MDHFGICDLCLPCFLSVHCTLVVTCWGKADLLALLCVMFYCVFVTFKCGVLGQLGACLILCLLSYFYFTQRIRIMSDICFTNRNDCNVSLFSISITTK